MKTVVYLKKKYILSHLYGVTLLEKC